MEAELNKVTPVHDDESFDEHGYIKIANISLAFKNGKIIKHLKTRGKLLGNGKFEEVHEIDSKINEVIKNELDEINTPIGAYVTF